MFPVRNQARHVGSAFCVSEWSNKSQSLPSPSAGTREHWCFHHQNHISHAFWPFCLSHYNLLGQAASWLNWYVYKFIKVLFPFQNTISSPLWFGQLLMAIIDFECLNCVNSVDETSESCQLMLGISKWSFIINL